MALTGGDQAEQDRGDAAAVVAAGEQPVFSVMPSSAYAFTSIRNVRLHSLHQQVIL